MHIPDRWNPRLWLRDALRLMARWLMRPTRDEELHSRLEMAKQLMKWPHVTAGVVASALDLDPEVLLQALPASTIETSGQAH